MTRITPPLSVSRGGATSSRPLDEIEVRCRGAGTLTVSDGDGRTYLEAPARARLRVTVSGAAGTHAVVLARGRRVDRVTFPVTCTTSIEDDVGRYTALLAALRYTMTRGAEAGCELIGGKLYRFFVPWLRDHVHTMKGLRYFEAELTSAIELFRDTQRQDGMIFDNIYRCPPYPHYWDQVLTEGGYLQKLSPANVEMRRIPVENDVEYLFIEGVYETWKATGDHAFLRASLPAALRAVAYATSDPHRWSSRHGLLKRGYTIDTWDFQPREDVARMRNQLSPMTISDATRFGVFHGDNTGMAAALDRLGEMLRFVDRAPDAARYEALARDLRARLDAVAWNGAFYAHHVPEDDTAAPRDLGDERQRLSMSNAYALNRNIAEDRARAIVQSYLDLRARLPPACPAEFLTVYPGYEHGFEMGLGEYMNMGVSTIAAGELARGALAHGFEAYGVDVLERVAELAASHGDYLHCCFRGWIAPPERRAFHPLPLTDVANVDFSGKGAVGVPGWTGEGDNDLAELPTGDQVFQDVPFHIADPQVNGRRGCVGLSTRAGYRDRAVVPVGKTARSLYLLHALSGGSGLAGTIVVRYADGREHVRHIHEGREVTGFWMPVHPDDRHGVPHLKVAWEGQNASCLRVGIAAFAMDLPYPDALIDRIELAGARDGALWLVAAMTLGQEDAWFRPSPVSYGIPDSWGAAAVTQALIEGLAGIGERGVALDSVSVTPRWTAAGVHAVTVRVTYPASRGYVAYRFAHDAARQRITLRVAGSGAGAALSVLLPAGAERVVSLQLDGRRWPCEIVRVRQSVYGACDVRLGAARSIQLRYA